MRNLLLILMVLGLQLSVVAQERTVRGTVKDKTADERLTGVSVSVKGTQIATSTNEKGEFTLRLPDAGPHLIVLEMMGFTPLEVVANTGERMEIELESTMNALEEVVAIGYGTSRRRDVTGAIASISADKIMEAPVASAMEAIQGRLPGVNISLTEGSPDAEINIRVRGGGSITQDNSPLFIVDGFPVPTIADIAPSDIETIDVLKDASSAAIYGARGANGVVIITTKSGKAGRFSVNYTIFGGPKRIANTLDVLTPYDYALWQYERSLLDQEPTRYTDFFGNFQDIDLYKETPGNDWQSQTFGRTGHLINNNLNINGGGEKTRYSFNYTNVKDKAIMQMSDFKRDNLTLRLNSKPYDNLTIDLALRYANTVINGGGTNEQNEVSSADSRLKFAMIFPPIPVSGLTDDGDTDPDFNLFSPLVTLTDNDRFQRRTNYNMNASLNWDIVEGLRFRTEGGLDYNNNLDNRFYGNSTYYVRNVPAADLQNQPAVSMGRLYRQSIRNANTLNYDFRQLIDNDDHKVSLLIGQEYLLTRSELLTNIVHGFPVDYTFQQATSLSNQGTPNSINNFLNPDEKLFSFFGRANYDYQGKYIINATLRADGSSKFLDQNRWGYFPSVSGAWRVSAEPFMQGTSRWLDDLKVRASYGTAGNDRIPPGLLFPTFNVSTTTWVNGFNSFWAASKTMANPDLKWETTISRNIGLDYSLLAGRLSGAIDLYKNSIRDLLIAFPVGGTGYDIQFRNMGETRNQGVELSLNWKAINKPNYGLDIGANMAFNRNKIISLGPQMGDYGMGSNWASTEVGVDYWVASGGQVGAMYGYQSDGRYEVSDFERFDEASGRWILREGVADASPVVGVIRPGSMKLMDIVGDDGRVTIDDRTVIGNANPLHTGGFNINARIHSFDIGTIFTYSYGNDIYNANKIEYTSTSKFHSRNMISTMGNGERWTNLRPDGTISNDPAELTAMNQNTSLWSPYMARYVFSDWAVEDGSFLRLNTLTLGYTVPKTWLANARIQNIRVYASAYNVFTWTNYSGFDPEVSTRRNTALTPGVDYSAYPRSRMVVFGLNLSL